ncbi:hypothetical protein ODR38_05860 [Pediococcus acidilactici]
MNLIQKYMQETPKQLEMIIEGSEQLFENIAKQNIERIMITGSGTSYHSGAQVQQLMRVKSGIEVESYYPFAVTPELFNGNRKKIWRFDFNRAKTCAKSQFVPLNQKLTVMPKLGTMVNFQLMLANYPTFGTLSFLILFTQ